MIDTTGAQSRHAQDDAQQALEIVALRDSSSARSSLFLVAVDGSSSDE